MKILSKTENIGKQKDDYLHLQPVISRKRTGFLWTFWLVRSRLTFSSISYFLFDIFRHLLFWVITDETEYLLLTWKCKVLLSKYALFFWASLLGYELINLCSFSFTYFQSPGEVIWFLYTKCLCIGQFPEQIPKVIRAFENMMDAGTLQELGLFSLEKTERRHDNSL